MTASNSQGQIKDFLLYLDKNVCTLQIYFLNIVKEPFLNKVIFLENGECEVFSKKYWMIHSININGKAYILKLHYKLLWVENMKLPL